MKYQYINENGLKQIRLFLKDKHKNGEIIDRNCLMAWARSAEFHLSEGNGAIIEISCHNTKSGKTELFTISENGISERKINPKE